jgi:hypothetical protein
MPKLIPLKSIPTTAARDAERTARAKHPSRAAALEAATYRIESAPGCHSRPYFDPPVIGWVLTHLAAIAINDQITDMPGGTCHHRRTYTKL